MMKNKTHYTKELTTKYRQLNDTWRRYDPVKSYEIAQDVNFNFFKHVRPLTDLMQDEIEKLFLKRGANQKKITLILQELLEVINQNIESYKEKTPILLAMDFEQLAQENGEADGRYKINHYKIIHEHSMIVKRFIDKFYPTKSIDNNDPKEIEPVEIYPKRESHKLILFNELGLIEKLRAKVKSDSELGQLIAVLLGVTDATKIATLTRLLPYIDSDPDGKLYTAKSKNAATSILAQFGIKMNKKEE